MAYSILFKQCGSDHMLLLGVDEDDARDESWGSSQANYRSDTIILARIDPKNQKITLVSIPRDTMSLRSCVRRRVRLLDVLRPTAFSSCF